MFDLFGNIEEQQKALQEKLEQIVIEHKSDDGAVSVTMNANRKLMDIKLDPSQFEPMDWEKLEDLILITLNEATELAEAKAAVETEKIMKDMLPGLGGLGKMFEA